MVKVMMALKGSGKTKTLVELVKKALKEEHGNVVCIEKDKDLTFDIPHACRLIHAGEYGINSNDLFRGFISGLHAGNYDITHIFVDNFYKMLSDTSDEKVAELLDWMDAFGRRENVKFTISATAEADKRSEAVRKYVVPTTSLL